MTAIKSGNSLRSELLTVQQGQNAKAYESGKGLFSFGLECYLMSHLNKNIKIKNISSEQNSLSFNFIKLSYHEKF